jgi:hypothetical protein
MRFRPPIPARRPDCAVPPGTAGLVSKPAMRDVASAPVRKSLMQPGTRVIAALLLGAASAAAVAQPAQGWIVEVTWQYEGQAGRTLRNARTGPGGVDTLVSGTSEVKIAAEARGTMEFTGKLRGAAAVNMPDSRNEQRYDSWRFKGGKPAFASIDMVAQYEQAARLNLADGEGANSINAERKGLVGRMQHERHRFEVRASGDDAGWFGDHADLQIDRVANKLMIVNRIDLQLNRKTVKPTRSYVKRMDKPAAAGEWDRSGPDEEAWRTLPNFALRNAIEFDIPPGADQFTLTRTYEASQLPDPHDSLGWPFPRDLRDDASTSGRYNRGRATLTLNVRRLQAAATTAPAPATPAAPAAEASQPASPQKTEPAKPAQPSATDEAVDAVRKLRGLLGR